MAASSSAASSAAAVTVDKRTWVQLLELIASLADLGQFDGWEEEQLVVLCAQGDERLMRLFSEHADHNRRLFVQECKRILPWCDPANSTRVLQDSAAVTVTLAGLPFPCLAPRAEPRQSDRVEQDQGATESGDPQAYREGVGKKNDNDVDFLLDELPNRDAELSPHTTPRSSVAHRQPENVASKTISVDLLDRASSAYSAADATPHQAHLFTVFSTLLTMTDSGEVTEVGPTSLETSGKESGLLSFLAAPFRSRELARGSTERNAHKHEVAL